ncbi:TDIFp like [Actinidia chinensis var. chinensis]|uniref:TDIFp like n=1 Tax=Actinidia chinensis var. chinensis TaxID=1590841 RepID=A0A2R6PX80_ACTCC|nr:TDIFp like [Actinidia chinensis var. chinensis]
MAKPSKTLHESFTKSKFLLLLVGLLLIVPPLFARPLDYSSSPNRVLLDSPTMNSFSSSTTTTSTTRNRQFEVAAHEVPSGPNPESNR